MKNIYGDLKVTTVPAEQETVQIIEQIFEQTGTEDPFYIVDLSKIVEQYRQWELLLPRVKPFYAVKCNPNPHIMRTIAHLGGGFDCASKAEISEVLALGVPKEKIIFANPCKQVSHCKFAEDLGLKMVTFDNEAELEKIKKYWPTAEVIMRIITDDSKSVCQFSTKFGAPSPQWMKLIQKAKDLDLNLVGISFHVGSGCGDVNAYITALTNARQIFDMANEVGFNMRVLDIGGGFPGTEDSLLTFPQIANAIREPINELFEPEVMVIAEPGRYFACASHTLVCNVFAKRQMPSDEPEYLYYINDGVYQSFNCIFFDHADVQIKTPPRINTDEKFLCSIYGPTCDALDCIAKKVYMPKLEIGDYLYFPNFGAYTVAAASAFNGFKTCDIHYIWRDNIA